MDFPDQHDDSLKWFGEGFDGFPKRLPDDCVEYIIYVVDDKLNAADAARARLRQISKAATDLTKDLLKDYIWQREEFDLQLYPKTLSRRSDDTVGPPHLRGRTSFGDSVADEWLVVYLLRRLSRQFPDAWMRVYDTDGEFLLIEAAGALPKWLNPDIAENRVWISNEHLRVIPLDESSTSRYLPLPDALEFIQSSPEKLVISPFIEEEAFYRLRDYPAAVSSSLHHAVATIPRRLAYILHRNPPYISPAIEAFYLRDPVSLKPLATKDISTLRFPPEDFVSMSVKFAKVGYAQLRSQIFDPPPAWTGVVPRMKVAKDEIGMKLGCGFEMMVSDPQSQDLRVVREIKLLLEDIENGEDALPSDADVAEWPQTQDDEKWLDVDYDDFEAELSGKGRAKSSTAGKGFGDPNSQDTVRKMISRFEEFMNNDTTGADGVDDDDITSGDEVSGSDSGEDEDGGYDEVEFEKAMREMMGMPADHIEKSGLLEEARKLAIADAEEQSDVDEDEEMKKVMELIEKELKGHGALDLNGKRAKLPKINGSSIQKPVFGPERPPGMRSKDAQKRRTSTESVDDEIGRSDGELSSDDEEFNDVDLGLAKNMLESFKGQAGMAGPAGNLLGAMGVNMPRDEDSDGE